MRTVLSRGENGVRARVPARLMASVYCIQSDRRCIYTSAPRVVVSWTDCTRGKNDHSLSRLHLANGRRGRM